MFRRFLLAVKRKLSAAIRLFSEDRSKFLTALTGRLERTVVFAALTESVAPPGSREGVLFKKLSDAELTEMAEVRSEVAHQVERLAEVGGNQAYGVFDHGRLACFLWLIVAGQDRRMRVRAIRLETGEAEITTAYTLPEFRGRGLFAFGVQALSQVARDAGVRRIYARTGVDNIPSQRALLKAGLKPAGSVVRVVLPLFPSAGGLIFRGHRWRTNAGVH